MRGRCAFTSTWDLTPDYSYFTWLFAVLNEKETKREKKWSYREANFHRFSRTFSPVNSSEYSQNSKISQWSGDFLTDQFNTTLKSTCTEHQVYTWLFLLFLLCLIVYYTKWKRAKKRKEMKLSPTRDIHKCWSAPILFPLGINLVLGAWVSCWIDLPGNPQTTD